MRSVAMFVLGAAVLVGAVGCPGVGGPPASAILAGDWTGTDANGVVVTVTFDDDGIVVSIAREDGVSAEVTNSTTELDGDAVTITIGGRTFEGTLSEDQNTITGTIEQEITAGGGDLVITIPAGDFEIDRVVDLCEGNACDDGDACNGVETCDADTGDCIAGTPVECAEGETCVDGDCVAGVDPCEGNTCDDGDACNGVETCDADTGDCVSGTPVECPEGQTCQDGNCVDGGGGVVANAGPDQDVNGGDIVQLDGSASTGALNFSWAQTVGTSVVVTGGDTDSPSFTAPNVTETLTFELTADDGMGGADTDSVDINVTALQATLFVVNNNSPMTSYANAGALTGEIPPTTRLNLGSATSLFQPRSIVVTRDGRLLISRQNGGIVGYDSALTADGSTPADVVVDGNNTDLETPISFAYDATNDRLFVGDANAGAGILVFDNVSSAAFDGDIAPDRTFGPPDRIPFNTGSTSISMTIDAMDLDSDGNLFVSDTSGTNANQSRILVFADPGSAGGLAMPIQEFTSDSWENIEDIVVDANDVFFVVASTDSVLMFNDASMLNGDVSPSAIMTVQLTMVDLEGIVVGFDGTGYLADRGNHAIYSYDGLAGLSGTLGPDRILDGFDTRLSSPRQMFLLEQ